MMSFSCAPSICRRGRSKMQPRARILPSPSQSQPRALSRQPRWVARLRATARGGGQASSRLGLNRPTTRAQRQG